ncbi:MAG: type II toxin-antitoxin system VapC family toxin [Methylococcaceae bacterium]|nr:MAG: type II toxin-antitoxin system VapC family toxin [Methylococcaceae bacterium]
MKYLLDTNVVSDFARGHPSVLERIKRSDPGWLGISSITAMEIEFGLRLHPERTRKLAPVLEALLSAITLLDFSVADAHAAAGLRATLQKRGTLIGAYDILLAGCALQRKLTFVTANTAEFARIDGLLLENWRNETA